MKFYEFKQNNSGGSFIANDKVCNRLFIEAKDVNEANRKAEELGCYWNGVSIGLDCPCCGDRWDETYENNNINLNKWKEKGYRIGIYSHYKNPEELWEKKYGKYNVLEKPKWKKKYSCKEYEGKIYFNSMHNF